MGVSAKIERDPGGCWLWSVWRGAQRKGHGMEQSEEAARKAAARFALRVRKDRLISVDVFPGADGRWHWRVVDRRRVRFQGVTRDRVEVLDAGFGYDMDDAASEGQAAAAAHQGAAGSDCDGCAF